MVPTTPTTSSTSATDASPSTAQTAPSGNNGESSQPKAKPTKPQAQAKPANANTKGKDLKEDGAGKGKSAKELKKEKRAALVAARGGGEEGDASGSNNTGTGATGRPEKVSIDGTPQPNSHSMSPSTSTSAHQNQTSRAPNNNNTTIESSLPPAPQRPEGFYSHITTHSHPNTREAFNSSRIHPLVIRLGVLMANGELRGANARTMGMMCAFKEVIRDYETPENVVMWKDLMSHLSPMISFLEGCRPKGTGGGNAIRWLKSEINRIGDEAESTEDEQKEYLIKAIDSYLEVRIHLADQVIASTAREKIKAGSSVVTFARSSVVEQALKEAWDDLRENDSEASFSVVVVDSRPLNEGLGLLEALTQHGIPCTYVLLTQSSHLIARSNLILLGGSALHSDGALYARSGTAMVAMMAKEHRIPVVACVETYKFGERVLLDGIATNEMSQTGDLFELPQCSGKVVKEELRAGITSLPLLYDLTPPQFITAVCTEIGFIPPSSVPTVLGKGQ